LLYVERNILTVDSGSNPDHDEPDGEIGKVSVLGGGDTRRTWEDGTKACYEQAPYRLNPYRLEGWIRKRFMTVRQGNYVNGQRGLKTIWSWGRGCDPKLEEAQEEKIKGIW
jgi:hypothetical protein